MPLITIQVTEDIAAKIRFMADAGIFAIAKGSATLNFSDNNLLSVKTEIYSYPLIHEVDMNQKTLILKESA